VQPEWLLESVAAAGLDPRLPALGEFFRIDRVRSVDRFNRLATMELALRGNFFACSPNLGLRRQTVAEHRS
jgi:hypothetical protein